MGQSQSEPSRQLPDPNRPESEYSAIERLPIELIDGISEQAGPVAAGQLAATSQRMHAMVPRFPTHIPNLPYAFVYYPRRTVYEINEYHGTFSGRHINLRLLLLAVMHHPDDAGRIKSLDLVGAAV